MHTNAYTIKHPHTYGISYNLYGYSLYTSNLMHKSEK